MARRRHGVRGVLAPAKPATFACFFNSSYHGGVLWVARMKLEIDLKEFRVNGKRPFKIAKAPTALAQKLYRDEKDLVARLNEYREEIDDLQEKMLAQDRYGVLLIFQAMDAAGKDGTIRHVMSGINPHGVEAHSFKRPSDEELDHDFLWRTAKVLPQRGRVGIFNRSYYEEVLVCKVHPEIVKNYQRLPQDRTKDMKSLWKQRYQDIRNHEAYLHNNGIVVIKFFLHVSKKEQKRRFLERIDTPSKNWKFNAADVKERARWKDYMAAYEEAINETATPDCPWYVVPADDKGNMRLIVSWAILKHLGDLKLAFPELPESQKAILAEARKALMAEKD